MTDDRPQPMRALDRANEVRIPRAALRRAVRDGETTVAAVIADRPPEAETMTVADLLRAQHRWSYTRMRKVLAVVPISETKTLGSLTDRQRRALVEILKPHKVPR